MLAGVMKASSPEIGLQSSTTRATWLPPPVRFRSYWSTSRCAATGWNRPLLPKRLALPVFCSDPLSSVAYATEQILLVLALGGLALLHLTPWAAAAETVAIPVSATPP
jgi:hypothetical protein